MYVQTHSYKTGPYSGCNYYKTVAEAYHARQVDSNIWKLSWEDHEGSYRYCPKYKKKPWYPLSEKILCGMSLAYHDASEDELFWVNQAIIPPNIDKFICRKKTMSDEEWDQLYMANCIVSILSDAEFREKYC